MHVKGKLTTVFFITIFLLGACQGQEQTDEHENVGGQPRTVINITATNWEFNKVSYKAIAGERLTINFKSEEGIHGLGIKGMNKINIQKNGSQEITLEPGEYQIYCTIPCGEGHAEMVATLIAVET